MSRKYSKFVASPTETLDDLTEYYRPILSGLYDSVDRFVIDGYLNIAHSPGGFRYWWNLLYGTTDNLDDTHLMRMAGRFSRRVRAWAEKHKIPFIDTKKGERKSDISRARIPDDPNFEGVFLVLTSLSPATIWHSVRLPGGDFHLDRKSPNPFVRHYHFHIMDQRWGHVTISISGHPPFKATIILNGHEFIDSIAKKKGLIYVKDHNCFTEISDPQELATIADTLRTEDAIGELRHVCDKWVYFCLSFGLSFEEQKRTGSCYCYSLYQVEYSRNLLFDHGTQMERVVDGIIDRNRSRLNITKITKIFGRKGRTAVSRLKREIPREEITFEKPAHDLTVFKIHFGMMTIKLYTKGESVLRSEAIINNMRRMSLNRKRLRRGLDHFPEIVTFLRDCLIRFLNELQAVDLAWINETELDDFAHGEKLGNVRVGGIDLRTARSHEVIKAFMKLALDPRGFRTGDLAVEVNRQRLKGSSEYTIRQAAYDIRKFRAKGVVEKTHPKSHVYRCSKQGLHQLSAFVTLEDEVIRPLVSYKGRVVSGNCRKSEPKLDLIYKQAQRGLQKLLDFYHLHPTAIRRFIRLM